MWMLRYSVDAWREAKVWMNYWLMKTEPSVFSWEDLQKLPNQTTQWEGVRNYQARNFMRDLMQQDDRVFFYHSVEKPQSIMGIAKVVREAYPDSFALDPNSDYYDPKSTPNNSRWVMVDIQWERSFTPPIPLEELKAIPQLAKMMLLQKGSRLSIQPVTVDEWNLICQLR
jgi:predicted RNA-binding protein with PUA-like domain